MPPLRKEPVKPLRILHLSDLHERAAFKGMPEAREAKLEWDARQRGQVLGDRFFESLLEVAKSGIDLVCFTGDLADWGHPTEYEKVTDRMDKILKSVKVPRNRFFAVPGNHDVRRNVQEEAWEEIRKWIESSKDLSKLGRWFQKVEGPPFGLNERIRESILERTAEFWKWFNSFHGANLKLSDNALLGYRKTLPGGTISGIADSIHIIGLDSSWLSGSEGVFGKAVLKDQGSLLLSEEQVEAHLLDGEQGLNGFKLVLVHHPLDHLADHHEIRRLLADNAVDILLHGHQHVPISMEVKEPGNHLRILASGCLIEGELGKNWPNGFQLLEINTGTKSGAVHFKKWTKNGRFWAKGSDIYKEAPDGILQLRLEAGEEQPSQPGSLTAPHHSSGSEPVSFPDSWFQSQIENAICNLGKRYSPELNFELEISKMFDALCRSGSFREHCTDVFHSCFLKINKAIGNLERSSSPDEIGPIKTALQSLFAQYDLSQSLHLDLIDPEKIDANCRKISETLGMLGGMGKKDEGKQSESSKYTEHLINEALRGIWTFEKFLKSPILALANRPVLVLVGDAGIGKSHLLADVASKGIRENRASILLLGQHFTSEEEPWIQILRNLRFDGDEKGFLHVLNEKGKAQGERLIIFIDAINEGKGRFVWPQFIGGFIKEFSRYPWVGLVLSVRSSYEKLIVPEDKVPGEMAVRIIHRGFQDVEYQASSFFFSQYGIEQPSIPLLHPEFSNPLFLKLFCEGLHRAGKNRIPKGYRGISQIIDFFLESVENKLSSPTFFNYSPSLKILRKTISRILEFKIESRQHFVPYESAFGIVNEVLSQFRISGDFLEALISEGVYSKNLFWKENDSWEEGIYLVYEKFEDHLTTAYLLEYYLDISAPGKSFEPSGKLAEFVDPQYFRQGIMESLSIQIPEKVDLELFELLPVDQRGKLPVIEAFINSLIWRKPETIKKGAKECINQFVFKSQYTADRFFQMVYLVASDPEHPFNANSLHRFLKRYSLPDLDSHWTVYLHESNFEGHPIKRLISWSLSGVAKTNLSKESRLLAGKALAWIFPSTDLELRDSATKALVVILENNVPILEKLLFEFEKVNDPYVYERIFAAGYGAVLRSESLEGLDALSKYIIKTIFKSKEVYPNVLVRDYARNIVEYALLKGVIRLKDPAIIRPPYRSQFPKNFPTNEEIDSLKKDYKGKDFKDYFWSQNSILSSMVTEYGRGLCSYGDFGRYRFQSAVDSWDKFDPNDLSNYACKLIFEKYGYDVEKHGEFDRLCSSGNRHENRTERIGKKYQWIALYEVLARLSDNHRMVDESTRWGKKKKYNWFQGPWEPFVRNIDPTSIECFEAQPNQKKVLSTWGKPAYQDWANTNENWLIVSENFPKPEEMLILSDENGEIWLALESFFDWDEPVPIGQEKYEWPHKHLWFQLRSYLVRENEAKRLISWAKKQHLMGRWFPESRDQYQVFCREYYWSPAYRFFDNPYWGGHRWELVYERENREKCIGKVLPTTEGHNWESGADAGDKKSYSAPRELIFSKGKFWFSKQIGEWLGADGRVACFSPRISGKGASELVVRKDILQEFLAENQLMIFWTCLGRKEIHCSSTRDFDLKKWVEVSGIYELADGGIKGQLNPIFQSRE